MGVEKEDFDSAIRGTGCKAATVVIELGIVNHVGMTGLEGLAGGDRIGGEVGGGVGGGIGERGGETRHLLWL